MAVTWQNTVSITSNCVVSSSFWSFFSFFLCSTKQFLCFLINSPFSGGRDSISQPCLLMLNRELICRRSFLMNGPARLTLFVIDVGGGGVLLLLFVVGGGVSVTVMLGGDWKWTKRKNYWLFQMGLKESSSYFWTWSL